MVLMGIDNTSSAVIGLRGWESDCCCSWTESVLEMRLGFEPVNKPTPIYRQAHQTL